MYALTAISLGLLLLYVLRILTFKYFWEQYPALGISIPESRTTISVVIAFRNELPNLPALLNSLAAQHYPEELYEVILVDDQSQDGSEILVQHFCRTHPNFHMVHATNEAGGKKSAILQGIRIASHEWIVTSDADCVMNEKWLASIDLINQQKEPDMIIGLVDMDAADTFLGQFQEVEFLTLVASGAGAAAGKNPLYCNGANLAYKRSLFLGYNDPMKEITPSGDDTLFLHTVKHDPAKSVLLLKALPGVVKTKGVTSWNEFIQQRRRWVSKSRYYRDPGTLYTGMLVLSSNLAVILSLVMLFTGRIPWLFPVLYAGKALADLVFMKEFFRFLNKDLAAGRFFAYELIYPFYVVFFVVTGMSSGFRWKGRYFRA
jgi:poly-beta-1,6-N-acetyl-D-glucosamine synthase